MKTQYKQTAQAQYLIFMQHTQLNQYNTATKTITLFPRPFLS